MSDTMTHSDEVSELLPCPFCGAAAEMEPWHGGAPIKQLISCSSEECDACPAVTGETPAEAIAAWNRRAANTTAGVASTIQLSQVGVTIERLQTAHVERQEEWCPDQKPDLSFRGNEMAGEVGEACNVIKKLERERHGWRGSRDTLEHLGEELADVVHTAVLCAITAGIDLGPYVVKKFNDTSEKNGLKSRIRSWRQHETDARTALATLDRGRG